MCSNFEEFSDGDIFMQEPDEKLQKLIEEALPSFENFKWELNPRNDVYIFEAKQNRGGGSKKDQGVVGFVFTKNDVDSVTQTAVSMLSEKEFDKAISLDSSVKVTTKVEKEVLMRRHSKKEGVNHQHQQ